jgi:hypothetical protein
VVERDPHGHAARRGVAQRPGHAVADRAGQADVVEREVERRARRHQPVDQPAADRVGPLSAADQCAEGDRRHGVRGYERP